MEPTLKDLLEKRRKIAESAKLITDKARSEGERSFTADERTGLDKLIADGKELSKQIDDEKLKAESDAKRAADAVELVRQIEEGQGRRTDPVQPSTGRPSAENRRHELPKTAMRFGRNRVFGGENPDLTAYRFGMWFMATLGMAGARRYCSDNGIEIRAQSEGTNTAGAYLVPEEFMNEIIDLREKRGVFRQYTRVVPMLRETKSVPRRVSGLTAYAVGEAGAGTESSKAWDNVQLVAKKWMVIARTSSELSEDAAINIGSDLAAEISYAFADKEDECGFNGDGTSTYHGIHGFRNKILTMSSTRANVASLVVGTGNAFSELVIADFTKVISRLPEYADTPNAAWFVHRRFYHEVMVPLLNAAGGQTQAEREAGARARPMFQGYPVVFSQVFPKVEANDIVVALLGDLSVASMLGDRREVAIQLSSEATVGGESMWEKDQIGIRGTTRFDINVHGTGDTNATAASQNPGPVIALAMAAS